MISLILGRRDGTCTKIRSTNSKENGEEMLSDKTNITKCNGFIAIQMNGNLCEINDCNLNLTYELIEGMVDLDWLATQNPHAKQPNVAVEQLVPETAYYQSPINNANYSTGLFGV